MDAKYCTKLEKIFKGHGKYSGYTTNRKIRLKTRMHNVIPFVKNTHTHIRT